MFSSCKLTTNENSLAMMEDRPKVFSSCVGIKAGLKWYYDQKLISLCPSDFKRVFVSHLIGKILRFEFYPKAVVFFSASLGFHGLPLFMVKTD